MDSGNQSDSNDETFIDDLADDFEDDCSNDPKKIGSSVEGSNIQNECLSGFQFRKVNTAPDNEFITVGTSDWKAQWRFPNITYCPHQGCVSFSKPYSSRSTALEHYRNTHAEFVVLCQICGKITSQGYFPSHYRLAHPTETMPFNFEQRKLNNNNNSNSSKDSSTSFDKNSLQVNEPVNHVQSTNGQLKDKSSVEDFLRRSMCPVCYATFSSTTNAKQHYQSMHDGISDVSPMVRTPSEGEYEAIREIDGVYECPVKNCHAEKASLDRLRLHWYNKHGDLELPEKLRLPEKRMRHNVELFSSTLPSSSSSNDDSLGSNESNDSVQIKCPKCPKKFATRKSVNLHYTFAHRKMHANPVKGAPASTPSIRAPVSATTGKCSVCRMNLVDKACARQHYWNVHGRTVKACPHCQSYFAKTYSLNKHIWALHRGERLPSIFKGQKVAIKIESEESEESKNTSSDQPSMQPVDFESIIRKTLGLPECEVRLKRLRPEEIERYKRPQQNGQANGGESSIVISGDGYNKPLDLTVRQFKREVDSNDENDTTVPTAHVKEEVFPAENVKMEPSTDDQGDTIDDNYAGPVDNDDVICLDDLDDSISVISVPDSEDNN